MPGIAGMTPVGRAYLGITTAVDRLNDRRVHNKVCGYAPIQQSHPTVRTSDKLAMGRYMSRRVIVTERTLGRDGVYVGMGEGRVGIVIHVYIYMYIYI